MPYAAAYNRPMPLRTQPERNQKNPAPEQRLRAIAQIVRAATYMPEGDRQDILALCAPFLDPQLEEHVN